MSIQQQDSKFFLSYASDEYISEKELTCTIGCPKTQCYTANSRTLKSFYNKIKATANDNICHDLLHIRIFYYLKGKLRLPESNDKFSVW